jgi:hypothetical protein
MTETSLLKAIPAFVDQSLSALRHPLEVKPKAFSVACDKLPLCERALGVTPKQSATCGERATEVQRAAEQAVLAAITPALGGQELHGASASELEQRKQQTQQAIEKVQQLLSVLGASEGIFVEIPDRRADAEPHRAYLFVVPASTGTVKEELQGTFGAAAVEQLGKDLEGRCSLDQPSEQTLVALFLDSDQIPLHKDEQDPSVKVSQRDKLYWAGYEPTSSPTAALLIGRIMRKLSERNILSPAQQELWQRINDDLGVNCAEGAIFVAPSDRNIRASAVGVRSPGWSVLGSPRSEA